MHTSPTPTPGFLFLVALGTGGRHQSNDRIFARLRGHPSGECMVRYPRAVSTLVSTKTQRHDMNPEQSKKLSRSRQIILDAIRELTALGHLITRGNLREATGLSMHIIDDHVSRMVDEDGALRRVRPGVYELVMGVGNMPAIYFTETDEGATIIEVEGCGKLVLDDHRVTRKIAERLSGSYAQVLMLEHKHQFGMAAQDLMLELKATKRELSQRLRETEEQCAQLRQQLAAKSRLHVPG